MTGISYTNGNAPESALVIIDGIHMVPSIAPRVNDFIAYAKTQGITLRIAHPYGGYRTFAEQGKLSGTGNSASTIPVAVAGKSTHGVYDTGRVDFVGADGYTYTAVLLAWIVANAGKFGLVREFGSADPNHFMASGPYNPAPQSEEFTIMDADTARALEQLRPIKMYALADDNGNVGGWAYFGPSGEQWNAPNPDYVALIASLGLSQSQPIATIRENVRAFLTTQFLPATNLSADQVQAAQQMGTVTSLSPAAVAEIVAGIGEPSLVLTDAQLGKITDAAKAGGAAAVAGLSFVTVAQPSK